MKKLGLLLIGGISAIVLLTHLGPMVALALSLVILYYVFKKFLKAESTGAKIGWGIFGFIVLMATVSNAPAIIGVVAAAILYFVYKKWHASKTITKSQNDPFTNFEKQWSELNKN